MEGNVTQIYFSPSGSTQKVSELFCKNITDNVATVDLLKNKTPIQTQFTKNDLVVFSTPVFAGRVPVNFAKQLGNFKGRNTPAVAIVTYGNRDYDDSLAELFDILTEGGFKVVGALAFVARHSVFPKVAEKRPDEKDILLINRFANFCTEKIAKGKIDSNFVIPIKGNRPYKKTEPLPLTPKTGKACINCGLCASLCPVDAIDEQNPYFTSSNKCIACTACIFNCPQNARSFKGPLYAVSNRYFQKKYTERKEPEIFF